MKRDPLAVRRPAQRLILGARVLADAARVHGRLRRIRRDDADVLRDIRIVRIVDDAAPRAEGDANPSAGWIPRRRFGLESSQRMHRRAVWGGDRHHRLIALAFEYDRAIAGDAGPVAVAIKIREPRRARA